MEDVGQSPPPKMGAERGVWEAKPGPRRGDWGKAPQLGNNSFCDRFRGCIYDDEPQPIPLQPA